MTVNFLPDASQELLASIEWYEERNEGLGERFLSKVHEAIAFICDNPTLHPEYNNGLRKIIISTFPYAVIYKYQDGSILVIAVAHLKRQPDYWKKRSNG